MSEDHIRYDILTQDALRGVVRKVLVEIEKTGLPGEHHFFISFATRASGVRISERLLEKYPEEMTIVLQNQYWNLEVNDIGFQVGLSFDGINEKLVIPFSAMKGFFDPSVQFGLQFDVNAKAHQGNENGDNPEQNASQDIAVLSPEQHAAKSESQDHPQDNAQDHPIADAVDSDGEPTEKVISLDAFRKKP